MVESLWTQAKKKKKYVSYKAILVDMCREKHQKSSGRPY